MALLGLIPLLGYILLWRRVTGSRSTSAAIHASSAVLLALYLGSIGGILKPVTIVLLVGGSLLAIYESLDLVRHKTPVPVPLGIFVALCGLFVLFHHDAAFYLYDEFSHWGIFLKEMLATDALWGSDSSAMVLRYLPGAPLWQYFFLRFTAFSEGGAYFAQFCLLMLPILVLWQGVKWRQFYWLFAIFALVAFTMANFGHGFASLYVDHVLGAWFAGTIFNFMLDVQDRTPRQLMSYALPVMTLVLIKDAGLFFAVAAIGIMALMLFWRQAFRSGNKSAKGGIVAAGALALICCAGAGLISASWNANRDAAGIPASVYSASGILSGLSRGYENDSVDAVELNKRFRRVVLHQQLARDDVSERYSEFNYNIMPEYKDRFRMTTASFILLFALWQGFVLYKLADPRDHWRWATVGTGLLLSAVAFIGILFLSYHFAFGERGITLPSYVRYAHTAILPMVLFAFLPMLPGFSRKDGKKIKLLANIQANRPTVVFSVLIVAVFVFESPDMAPLYKPHVAPDLRRQMKPLIDRLRDSVGEDASVWIYLPLPDASGARRRVVLYDMAPVRTEVVTDPDFLDRNAAALTDVIARWDYMWFPIENPDTEEALHFLFGEDLKDRVFRVDRSNGNFNIVALNGVF